MVDGSVEDFWIYDKEQRYCIEQQMLEKLSRTEKHKRLYNFAAWAVSLVIVTAVVWAVAGMFKCIFTAGEPASKFAELIACIIKVDIALFIFIKFLNFFKYSTADMIRHTKEAALHIENHENTIHIKRSGLRKCYMVNMVYEAEGIRKADKMLFSMRVRNVHVLDKKNLKHLDKLRRQQMMDAVQYR